MKNSKKKTILTIFALFLIVAVAVVGSVTAYWTAGLTSIPNGTGNVQVTVGKAKEIEAVFDVNVNKYLGDGTSPFTASNRLVPAGRIAMTDDEGSTVTPVEQLVIKAEIKVRGTNYTEHIVDSDLQKVKATLSVTGVTIDKLQVTGDLAQTINGVQINNSTATVFQWTIQLKEPADKAAYEALKEQTITFNILVEKVA